ncbi:hypothetical protein SAMN05661091_1892 [Paenibacillus uliginis N3/975]|uniref:Uncharacterized protein n=1 Tax=Paenibacillus uliginis N3/975 TaxID=1313296 RepID=A0A1X7H849_9BACL|nr:hypothetical protein [Paenibacillus uliginis]SMF80842.1 hypothetical protein SAMN05661091_1892 [Paenibacillus uliginis N3/975]
MSGIYLDHLDMKRESKSFTDSLYAVLTSRGLFQGPKYMLSGLTGMAFKFTVHERLLPMSVSAYGQLGTEHLPAIDNLGIYTVSDGGYTRHPTFQRYQQEAVQWVKESLSQGIGVIYWLPEFGVIRGYDDEDEVFFIQDGYSFEDQIVLYDNFGLNSTDFWYIQLLGEKVDVPLKDMILESLRLAIQDWDIPHKTLPSKDIASGKLAYHFLVHGLESGTYDEFGAVYILDTYIDSRIEIRNYLREAVVLWPDLQSAYELYSQLTQVIGELANYLTDSQNGRQINRAYIPVLIEALLAAKDIEDQAVNQFRDISRRYPDPKRSTIPRWGAHMVR